MKKPEDKLDNLLKSSIGNYSENATSEDWERISKSLDKRKKKRGFGFFITPTGGLLLLSFLAISSGLLYLYSRPTLAQNKIVNNPVQINKERTTVQHDIIQAKTSRLTEQTPETGEKQASLQNIDKKVFAVRSIQQKQTTFASLFHKGPPSVIKDNLAEEKMNPNAAGNKNTFQNSQTLTHPADTKKDTNGTKANDLQIDSNLFAVKLLEKKDTIKPLKYLRPEDVTHKGYFYIGASLSVNYPGRMSTKNEELATLLNNGYNSPSSYSVTTKGFVSEGIDIGYRFSNHFCIQSGFYFLKRQETVSYNLILGVDSSTLQNNPRMDTARVKNSATNTYRLISIPLLIKFNTPIYRKVDIFLAGGVEYSHLQGQFGLNQRVGYFTSASPSLKSFSATTENPSVRTSNLSIIISGGATLHIFKQLDLELFADYHNMLSPMFTGSPYEQVKFWSLGIGTGVIWRFP